MSPANDVDMKKRQITLQKVQRFIRSSRYLRANLQRDYLGQRLLREADLQACAYFHLRVFLKPDKRWRVFVNAYHKGLGRYPDLTIMERQKPRLAIELKWRTKTISGKDRRTLKSFLLNTRHARKAYFVTTVKNKSQYQKVGAQKIDTEKNRLIEIAVNLDLHRARSKEFKAERKSIKEALK